MIFAIIACICWSIAIFPVTEAVKRIGHLPVNFFRHLIAFFVFTAFILIVNPLFFKITITDIKFKPLAYLLLSGILGLALSDLLRLKSLQILGIKTVSIFSSFQPVISLSLGFCFLNEHHNFIGITGLIFVCSGLLIYVTAKKEVASLYNAGYKLSIKAVGILLICMLLQGFAIVFSKLAIFNLNGTLQPFEMAFVRIIGAVSVMLILALIIKKLKLWLIDFKNNKNKANNYFIISTFLGNIIAVSFSLYALSMADSVIVQSIFSLVPFFILPINYFINKEKITLTTITSFLISITGVYLTLWEKSIIKFIV